MCLEGLSPPPPRVSFAAKLLGILAWVGCWGAQIAATTGWQPGAVSLKAPARPEPAVSLETSAGG